MKKEAREFQGCFAPAFLFQMVEDKIIGTTEFLMYLTIGSFQKSGLECWMSNGRLGQRMGLQKRQGQRVVTRLIELELIRVQEKEIDGTPTRVLSTSIPASYSAHPIVKSDYPPIVKSDYLIKTKENALSRGQAAGFGLQTEGGENGQHTATGPTSAGFQRTWIKMYRDHHGRGYIFGGKKDGAAIKTIHARLKGDRNLFRQTIGRFFADTSEFYRGHSITRMLVELNKWTTPTEGEDGYTPPTDPDEVQVRAIDLTEEQMATFKSENPT